MLLLVWHHLCFVCIKSKKKNYLDFKGSISFCRKSGKHANFLDVSVFPALNKLNVIFYFKMIYIISKNKVPHQLDTKQNTKQKDTKQPFGFIMVWIEN